MTNTTHNELQAVKRELAFIARTLQSGHLDFETLDELCKSIRDARASLEAHELSLLDEEAEGELLAA